MTLSSQKLLHWYQEMGLHWKTEALPINRLIQENSMASTLFPMDTPPNLPKEMHSLSDIARKHADEANALDILEQKVRHFEGLDIQKIAQNTVFSDGNKAGPIMLVGEAPGAQEDLEGIPFCGASGMLLNKILKTIDITREENLYVTNNVFWRPPANRRPTQEELDACFPFLEKHIALIAPKFLLVCGATATASLLKSKEGITKLRGKIYQYSNIYCKNPIPMAVIFHPSYLLRQPSQKALMWQDLLFIKKYLMDHSIF